VRSEKIKHFHYLDVLGASGNLLIDRHSVLDFFPEAGDAVAVGLFAPKKPYVTVQNGVDSDVMRWSRMMGQRPTKLLPASTWQETVRLLQAANLTVIQLCTNDDERIEGVDMDLRGCTTLGQAAVILKSAVCHVGIEGGLVHLAGAVNVKSVVAFGPTSSAFLGYPQNINLVASDCDNCWWTTKDWYMYCPRGLAGPPCMNAYGAAMIAGAVLSIYKGSDATAGLNARPPNVQEPQIADEDPLLSAYAKPKIS
jgi:ADP-heptose:LPS heptosyltransferase